MTAQPSSPTPIRALRAAFPGLLQEQVSLAGYTTARAGGKAEALLTASSMGELEQIVLRLWDMRVPFHVLGYGSNVLVSDRGVRGVVVINRARAMRFDTKSGSPSAWAESGALIGTIARQAALRGLSGFEWAAAVPGTLGGALYGNAGAFGGDMAGSLLLAEILHPNGKEEWPAERMQYQYRSSILKRERIPAVILSAQLKLEHGDPQQIQQTMEEFAAKRRSTQPPGASMGSIFKNPPGDYAGRLIEAAGLKGKRIGDAEISSVHANFFINHGQASAADIGSLIHAARETVAQKFGVALELEVELLGDWSTVQNIADTQDGAGRAGAGAERDDER